MRYKILIIFGVLLLPASFISSSANAEEIEKLTLRSAIEQALHNNLNLQLRQEDVNSAEGVTLSAEGKFDVLFEANANAQTQELTPIVFGGATQEDTADWSATASKVFTTGTSIGLGWNNNSYNSDTAGLLLDPYYNTGLMLSLRQPLLRGLGIEATTLSSIQSSKSSWRLQAFR